MNSSSGSSVVAALSRGVTAISAHRNATRILRVSALPILISALALALGCNRAPDLSSPLKATETLVTALNDGDVRMLTKIYGEDIFEKQAAACKKVQENKTPDQAAESAMPFLRSEREGNAEQDCGQVREQLVAFMAQLRKGGGLRIVKVEQPDKTWGAAYIAPPNSTDDSTDVFILTRAPDGRWLPSPQLIRYRANLRQARAWESAQERQ